MTFSIDANHVTNAAQAKALYLDNLKPEEGIADWNFAVRSARRAVAAALRESQFLSDIAGALERNCGHSLAFRHLMAPPVSQDQFRLLCPLWSKSAENKSKRATLEAATAAEQVIRARLNKALVKWEVGSRPAHALQIRPVLTAIPILIAQQKIATARRNRLAFEQEYAVVELLEGDGWTKLASKLIDTRAAVPPKHFMHKTRFATGTTAHQEVDIACGLRSTVVLALECKVTNDETNSVKRINDVIKKGTAWKDHWGNFVLTAALLQGVVAAKDVQRLTDANVIVFWSHELDDFRTWLQKHL
jgi:XamI restriction endonuclease